VTDDVMQLAGDARAFVGHRETRVLRPLPSQRLRQPAEIHRLPTPATDEAAHQAGRQHQRSHDDEVLWLVHEDRDEADGDTDDSAARAGVGAHGVHRDEERQQGGLRLLLHADSVEDHDAHGDGGQHDDREAAPRGQGQGRDQAEAEQWPERPRDVGAGDLPGDQRRKCPGEGGIGKARPTVRRRPGGTEDGHQALHAGNASRAACVRRPSSG
jgi:hypothetical protein